MLIIAGLGNPGPKHARQRHNIGFMAADEIIRRYNLALRQSRHHAYVAEGVIGGEKILLLKPKTFMNDPAAHLDRRCGITNFAPVPSPSCTTNWISPPARSASNGRRSCRT